MGRRFSVEVERLKEQLLALSSLVEESVHYAVKAITDRDLSLAQKVRHGDDLIDAKEVEIEEECLKLLALYQPVAHDLRFIVAVLKINNDLERIGDLALNIGHRVETILRSSASDTAFDLPDMATKVKAMLRKSLSALVNLDVQVAREVLASDDDVDKIHRSVYAKVVERVSADPKLAEIMLVYLSVSRNLERIADHATNIAEDVIYLADGEIVRHGRVGPSR